MPTLTCRNSWLRSDFELADPKTRSTIFWQLPQQTLELNESGCLPMRCVADGGFEGKIKLSDGFLSVRFAYVLAPQTIQLRSNNLPVANPLPQFI
jgi:hypothetical protein